MQRDSQVKQVKNLYETDNIITLDIPDVCRLDYDKHSQRIVILIYKRRRRIEFSTKHLIALESVDNLTIELCKTLAKYKVKLTKEFLIDYLFRICPNNAEGICYGERKMKRLHDFSILIKKSYYYYNNDFYFWFYKNKLYVGYDDLMLTELTNDNYRYTILCILYDANITEIDESIINKFLELNKIKQINLTYEEQGD